MSIMEDFYPGSKTPRQPPVVVDEETEVEVPWDASPIIRTVRGKEMEFFGISSMAAALGRSIVSVRLWERKGYIPRAPYRLPDHSGGKGNRLYTRAIIKATMREFEKVGVLDPGTRIRWATDHKNLTIRLVERWSALVENQQ